MNISITEALELFSMKFVAFFGLTTSILFLLELVEKHAKPLSNLKNPTFFDLT